MIIASSRKLDKAEPISFEDLSLKVIRACEELGIRGVILREWKPNPLENESTWGVAREKQYDTKDPAPRFDKDIGYLKNCPEYGWALTSGSFHVNHKVFSPQVYGRFLAALEKQGLQPKFYHAHPLGPRFYTKEEVEESLNPHPKYV